MNKLGAVAIVVALVIGAYLLLMVAMPIITEAVSTANITMTGATANFTTVYPGTAEATLATPWALFFVPGVIGITAIIIILKKPGTK